MTVTLLKSKLHGAYVTEANTEYEGSISIDSQLMDSASILPYEQVEVYNITNGQRFTTYAIAAEAESGEICVNGAAARLVTVGDRIIIVTYVGLVADELATHRPRVIRLDKDNRPRS